MFHELFSQLNAGSKICRLGSVSNCLFNSILRLVHERFDILYAFLKQVELLLVNQSSCCDIYLSVADVIINRGEVSSIHTSV